LVKAYSNFFFDLTVLEADTCQRLWSLVRVRTSCGRKVEK
jgi:hypothetical protein